MLSWILSKKFSLGTTIPVEKVLYGAFVTCIHIHQKFGLLQPNEVPVHSLG